MTKKMALLAMMFGAIAGFAVPATASAQTITENKVPLAVGATFLATGTNIEITTSAGHIKCKKLTWDLTVLENTNEQSFAQGKEEGEGCTVTQNGVPVTITSAEVEMATEGGGTGEVTLSFVADIAGVLTCTFSGTIPLTYEPESQEFAIAGVLSGTGAGCPGVVEMHGNMADETKNIVPVQTD